MNTKRQGFLLKPITSEHGFTCRLCGPLKEFELDRETIKGPYCWWCGAKAHPVTELEREGSKTRAGSD